VGKWEMVRLGDVCTLLNGRAYKQDELLTKGKTPVLRVGNFFSNRDWFYSDLELDENKYCDYGDLLYAWSASFGPKIWEGPKVIYHYHIWKVLISERVNKAYLYYLLERITREVIESGRGIAMIHTTKSDMEQREIPIPPLHLQQKIADILNHASNLIEKRKAQIEKLDVLIKSQFVEMFGDPVMNPMGWEVCKLGNLGKVGSSKRVFTSELKETGVPFYRGTEVAQLSFGEDIEPKYFISEEHYKSLKDATGVPAAGDLLLPSICAKGEVWRVNRDSPFYFKDGRVLWIHLESPINSEYVCFALRDKLIRDFSEIASGTTFAEMKIVLLKEIDILMPPLDLQNRFADFVRQADKSKFAMKRELEKLQLLYKSLMQKCFNGEMF